MHPIVLYFEKTLLVLMILSFWGLLSHLGVLLADKCVKFVNKVTQVPHCSADLLSGLHIALKVFSCNSKKNKQKYTRFHFSSLWNPTILQAHLGKLKQSRLH